MFRDKLRFFVVVQFWFIVLFLFGCYCFYAKHSNILKPPPEMIAHRGKVSSVGASWCTCEKRTQIKKVEQPERHIKNIAIYAFEAEKKNASTVKRKLCLLNLLMNTDQYLSNNLTIRL